MKTDDNIVTINVRGTDGKWSEYLGDGEWDKNSNIKVKCAGD